MRNNGTCPVTPAAHLRIDLPKPWVLRCRRAVEHLPRKISEEDQHWRRTRAIQWPVTGGKDLNDHSPPHRMIRVIHRVVRVFECARLRRVGRLPHENARTRAGNDGFPIGQFFSGRTNGDDRIAH